MIVSESEQEDPDAHQHSSLRSPRSPRSPNVARKPKLSRLTSRQQTIEEEDEEESQAETDVFDAEEELETQEVRMYPIIHLSSSVYNKNANSTPRNLP